MFWPSVGIASIATTWIGLLFLIRRWPGDNNMTFSQHAAQTKVSQIYYAILFVVTITPFYLFSVIWLAEELNLPTAFYVLITTAHINMLIAGFVPETNRFSAKLHRAVASIAHFLLMPVLIVIGLSDSTPMLARVITIASVFCMAGIVTILSINKAAHPKMLLLQGTYIAMFHLSFIVTTLLQLRIDVMTL